MIGTCVSLLRLCASCPSYKNMTTSVRDDYISRNDKEGKGWRKNIVTTFQGVHIILGNTDTRIKMYVLQVHHHEIYKQHVGTNPEKICIFCLDVGCTMTVLLLYLPPVYVCVRICNFITGMYHGKVIIRMELIHKILSLFAHVFLFNK